MYTRTLQFAVAAMLLVTNAATANAEIWQELVQDLSIAQHRTAESGSVMRHFRADDQALRNALSNVPRESSGDRSHQIRIPMPDGTLALFTVLESPILAPAEAAMFPQIKTFRVFGVDDIHASGRIDITPIGFHGMVQTSKGMVYVDPQDPASQDQVYRSRFRGNNPGRNFSCGVHKAEHPVNPSLASKSEVAYRMPGNILTYRLAVAATHEYVNAAPGAGTATQNTTAAIASTINRVSFIYERDLGIRFSLVGTDGSIYETVDNGQLDNENDLVLLGQANDWIDDRLGDSAYDIGHVFSKPATIGGGIANIGVVCDDSLKAGGVSGLPDPFAGDTFDIDFVAHEIGHQFNAEHSFNGTTNACANRNASTAYEPGSGSTIMAYAGICAAENLQPSSDATFHAGSIAEINAFADGFTLVCASQTPNGNSDPTIATPAADRVIPTNTPFALDNGTATDAIDGDSLTYQWDQMDVGASTDSVTFGTDLISNPLFRSYPPQTDSRRDFPALGTQLRGLYDDAEVMPCKTRDLDFRLTVRDGNSGQVTDNVRVSVDAGSGPFRVTSYNQTTPAQQVLGNSNSVLVTWNVAGTSVAPVSCADVDIELLTFNDSSYSMYSVHSLEAGSPNDGAEVVGFPEPTWSHPRARIRVRCSDNIFYDINDADIEIIGTDPGPLLYPDTDHTTFHPNNLTLRPDAPACTTQLKPPRDSGSIDYFWLLLLGMLAATSKWLRRQG